MATKIKDEDYFEQIDGDDAYDDFEEKTNKKHSQKRNHAARHRLETMREERELNKLISDDFYEYDEFDKFEQFNDWN